MVAYHREGHRGEREAVGRDGKVERQRRDGVDQSRGKTCELRGVVKGGDGADAFRLCGGAVTGVVLDATADEDVLEGEICEWESCVV